MTAQSLGAMPILYLAEPPVQYLVRPPMVLDCSALAGIVFQEPWKDEALQRISGRNLHAPSLLNYEIASVALKKMRRGEHHAADGIEQAMGMDIELHNINLQEVCELALRHQLSAYDAAYLWLAAELKAPLATFDQKLATAAQAHLSSLP